MTDNSVNDENVHPLVIFGGSDCQDLSKAICRYSGIPISKADTSPFPNGESFVRLQEDVRGRDVFVIVSVCRQHNADEGGYTGTNDCLMELLVFGDTLRRASAHRITAVIPYFGYARQDRKAAGRTPITARLVADMITMAGFNRVLTMDLHTDQIQGFFSRDVALDHLNAGQLFADYFNSKVHGLDLEESVLMAPDTGNLKKAEKYRRGFKFKTGLAVVDKIRAKDGTIKSQRISGDDIKGRTVIMIDDVISTAETMKNAIDLGLHYGATGFILGATHGEFVGKAIENLAHPAIHEIAITNTIPISSRIKKMLPLRIIDTEELISEAILRIHRFESISELLGVYG